MLNSYYICDKQIWLDNVELFHPTLGSHYIDLPNGRVLVSANFPDNHYSQEQFESLDGVVALPHPVFEGTKPLDQENVDALTAKPEVSVDASASKVSSVDTPVDVQPDAPDEIAPSALDGITTASTVLDVASAAAQINPLMKLRSF